MHTNHTYFIPTYNKLVYCHAFDGDFLTLGGMSNHVGDARTNIMRQKLHKEALMVYEFKLVDLKKLATYVFLQPSEFDGTDYHVVNPSIEILGPDYLAGSLVLHDMPRSKYFQPLPTEN